MDAISHVVMYANPAQIEMVITSTAAITALWSVRILLSDSVPWRGVR